MCGCETSCLDLGKSMGVFKKKYVKSSVWVLRGRKQQDCREGCVQTSCTFCDF